MEGPDWGTYLPLVILSLIILGINLWQSRKYGAYALLHPNGTFAFLVWLHAIGLVLAGLRNGEWPRFFGLHTEHIYAATLMLISGQLGFLVGTLLPRNPIVTVLPTMKLSPRELELLENLLGFFVVTFSIGPFIDIASSIQSISQAQYGANQEGGKPTQFLYSLYNLVGPSFNAILFSRAVTRRPIFTRGTIVLAFITIFPALISGGRRAILVTVGMFLLATFLRADKLRIGRLAIAGVVMMFLSSLIVISRSGETLDPNARVEAVMNAQEEQHEGIVDHTLLVFSGTIILTAAMKTFPDLHPFTYGSSYVRSMVNVVVPSALTGSYVFTPPNEIFRQAYYRDTGGIGLDYLLAAEGYQNFSYFGPFIAFMGVGFLLATTFDAMKKTQAMNRFSPMALVHLQCFVISAWCLRTDSNAYLKTLTYSAIWVFILALIARTWAAAGRTTHAS